MPMKKTENLKEIFDELVTAYEEGDEAAKESLTKKIKESGKSFRVEVDDDLQWEESQVEGYEEAPTVIQTVEVFLGEVLVYEDQRWYGSEMVDPTHTGLGGRWETIRVDGGGDDVVVELLEDFGETIDEPDVPPWR
jgi:hypothetical protein